MEVTRIVEVVSEPEPVQELTKIDLQLGWLKDTSWAGFFAADQLGYYEEEGLEVNFISGGSGIDPISIVRQNPNMFGASSSNPSFINAVSRGAPLVTIGCFYQFHPGGFTILADSDIDDWTDFENHRIGVQPEAEHWLDVIANVYDLDRSSIEVVRVGYDPTPLLTDQIDAFSSWIVNQPYQIEQAGYEWKFLFLAEIPGIGSYGTIPFVHRDLLEKNPELVERFMRATIKGWDYTLDHSDEVANWIIDEYLPGGALENQLFFMEQGMPVVVSEDTAAHGLGYCNPERWSALIDTLLEYDQIENAVTVADVMTNEFVEASPVKR
jgi:NitT/TauT family transport system substrate-binding protein